MKAKVIKTGEIVEVYHEPQHGQITNIYKEAVLVNGRMWDETELDFNCITKANEAPEKVYFSSIEDGTHYYTEGIPFEREYVEYTRTDALIEKACDAYCKVCGHYHHTTPNHICRQACDYYKDFVNYMKGG